MKKRGSEHFFQLIGRARRSIIDANACILCKQEDLPEEITFGGISLICRLSKLCSTSGRSFKEFAASSVTIANRQRTKNSVRQMRFFPMSDSTVEKPCQTEVEKVSRQSVYK